MSHDEKMSTLKKHNLCINCLNSGHYVKNCKSSHKCKKCQRLHHTLLHSDPSQGSNQEPPQSRVIANPAVKLKSSSLLMTCRVLVKAADDSLVEARALLDNASSASFITERLVQSLGLRRVRQNVYVSGIAGSSPKSPTQFIASFQITTAHSKMDLTDPRLLVTFLSILSLSVRLGITSQIFLLLILPLDNQVALICFSELTCLLMFYSTAGGTDLPAHLWPLKPSLVGCSAAAQTQQLTLSIRT